MISILNSQYSHARTVSYGTRTLQDYTVRINTVLVLTKTQMSQSTRTVPTRSRRLMIPDDESRRMKLMWY